MATLKESAEAYVPPQTLNIAELEKVSVSLEVLKETHQDSEGKEFTLNVIEVDGLKYRVPQSVLKGIKGILGKLPNTKYVTVLKDGTGMNTSYQVLPVNVVE